MVAEEDSRSAVIAASHGGANCAEYALQFPFQIVFFNDAGVGKDNAGIVALEMLQAKGVAAGAIAHTSARIGDANDMWENGIISSVNERGRDLGFLPGAGLKSAMLQFMSRNFS